MEYVAYVVYAFAIFFAICATMNTIKNWRRFRIIAGPIKISMHALFRLSSVSIESLLAGPAVSIQSWGSIVMAFLSYYSSFNLIWLIPLSVYLNSCAIKGMTMKKNPYHFRNLERTPKAVAIEIFVVSSIYFSIFLAPTIYFSR